MKVDINYVKALFDEIQKINKVLFNEIEWYDGDTKLNIPQNILDEWKFVGMTNCSFVETGFFREDPNATWEERDKVWKDNGEQTPFGEPLIPNPVSLYDQPSEN